MKNDKNNHNCLTRYEVLTCKTCKNIVWVNEIRLDENAFTPMLMHKHPEHLAYAPVISYPENRPTKKVSKCKCKTDDFESVKYEYALCAETKKKIQKNQDHLRGICPHKEWTLVNFGDWHFNQVTKMCTACDKDLDYPTKEEIAQWLKDNPNYTLDKHGLTTKGPGADTSDDEN